MFQYAFHELQRTVISCFFCGMNSLLVKSLLSAFSTFNVNFQLTNKNTKQAGWQDFSILFFQFKFSFTGATCFADQVRLYYNYFGRSSSTVILSWMFHDLALFKFKFPFRYGKYYGTILYNVRLSVSVSYTHLTLPTILLV